MAREKGVKIALGSDTVRDGVTPYGIYTIREILTMAEAGMTSQEAIRSATQTAAEVLGLAEHIGTIEPGKFADLLVMKKNPVEELDVLLDRSNLLYVLQGGKCRIAKGKLLGFGDCADVRM
jgi:imidazolonepropionase-like amidohydrolase